MARTIQQVGSKARPVLAFGTLCRDLLLSQVNFHFVVEIQIAQDLLDFLPEAIAVRLNLDGGINRKVEFTRRLEFGQKRSAEPIPNFCRNLA